MKCDYWTDEYDYRPHHPESMVKCINILLLERSHVFLLYAAVVHDGTNFEQQQDEPSSSVFLASGPPPRVPLCLRQKDYLVYSCQEALPHSS